jgi:hypothetical protein
MKLPLVPLTRFAWFFAAVASLLLLTGCFKEKSVETPIPTLPPAGAGGSSTFTLVASGSNCSDATVAGSYVKGTAMALTNIVAVTVDVTKVGTWTYSTGLVQGFGFTGSGTFTTTGPQMIALLGTGTPIATGHVTFPLNIGSTSCSFTITVAETGGGGNQGNGEYYYKATIGGVNYFQEVTDNNNYEAGSGMGGQDDVSFGAGINHTSGTPPAGFTDFGVSKGIMHNYLTATKAQFYAFFAPGEYPYVPPGNSVSSDGVAVGWTDKAGIYWDSWHPTKAQPSTSKFKIISVEDAKDALGRVYIKVKMQFNCTLFKENSTDEVVLTNGEMVGVFGML